MYIEYDISRCTALQLQRDWSRHSIHRRVNRREFLPSLKSKIFEIKTFALHMTLDDGRRRVNEKGGWDWQGEDAASYARKQEDATVKNPARGTKNVSERESDACVYVCIPTGTPTRKGCPPLPDIWPPFSAVVRLRVSHTDQGTTIRVYVYARAWCAYARWCPHGCIHQAVWILDRTKREVCLNANYFQHTSSFLFIRNSCGISLINIILNINLYTVDSELLSKWIIRMTGKI